MTARAIVQHDFAIRGVAVMLGREIGDGRTAVVEPIGEIVFNAEPEGVAVEPSLRLPEDLARALLDALAAHFGGTSDVLTLRKDYLAERARVDKMIDHLTTGPGVGR